VAATAVLAVLVGAPFAAHELADLHTGRGEVRRVALPDGSIAWLDSDSALDLRFTDGERRVSLLSGRAWFDVRRDPAHPFQVAALGGTVTDLDTAFSVARDGDEADVTVTQGRVRLAAGGSDQVLAQGSAVRWRAGAIPTAAPAVDPAQALAWTHGRLVLAGTPLKAAVAALGRYRPGATLLWPGADDKRPVSGVFSIAAIDAGLDTLAASQNLQVVRLSPWLTVLRAKAS
jgi:transmembrane sensor